MTRVFGTVGVGPGWPAMRTSRNLNISVRNRERVTVGDMVIEPAYADLRVSSNGRFSVELDAGLWWFRIQYGSYRVERLLDVSESETAAYEDLVQVDPETLDPVVPYTTVGETLESLQDQIDELEVGGGAVDSVDGRTGAVTLSDLYAAIIHSHAVSDITGLQAALDAKQPAGSYAAASHTHTIADVTGLQTALDGKAASSHTHAQSDVTNLSSDLALKAPLASPAFTGTPTGITKAHVGLGNVDNTADTAKPVSTAQQTALDLKANLASPALTGNPTAPTASPGDNDTSIATTAFVAAALAAAGGGVNIYPRKSGQYYTTTHLLQSINTDAGVFGTAGTRGFLIPVVVTESTPIDRFGINVATAGGSGCAIRMAFYPHDTAWGTVSKVVSGSVAGDSTGDKAVTISATLTPGFYWLLVSTTDTTGTLVVRRAAGFGGQQGDLGGGVTFFSTEWALQYNSLVLTSDAPATINLGGSSGFVTNDVPLAYFRKA